MSISFPLRVYCFLFCLAKVGDGTHLTETSLLICSTNQLIGFQIINRNIRAGKSFFCFHVFLSAQRFSSFFSLDLSNLLIKKQVKLVLPVYSDPQILRDKANLAACLKTPSPNTLKYSMLKSHLKLFSHHIAKQLLFRLSVELIFRMSTFQEAQHSVSVPRHIISL